MKFYRVTTPHKFWRGLENTTLLLARVFLPLAVGRQPNHLSIRCQARQLHQTVWIIAMFDSFTQTIF